MTLGDALPPLVKNQLHRLRDTLEKQARDAVASQLAETRPPWRRRRRSSAPPKARGASDSGPQTRFARYPQQPERQKAVIGSTSTPPRKHKAAPLPPLRAFEYWDFPSEAVVCELPTCVHLRCRQNSFRSAPSSRHRRIDRGRGRPVPCPRSRFWHQLHQDDRSAALRGW